MKLKKALGIFSEKYKDPSICESCGEEFICGATVMGCWCMNLKVPDEGRADMKEKYAKCLCPKCLGTYATESAIVVRYKDGRTEVVKEAVRVDTQNFHEGMLYFYDAHGMVLKQISMNEDISWDIIAPLPAE